MSGFMIASQVPCELNAAGDLLFTIAKERARELQRDAERGRAYRRSAAAAK